MCSLTGCGPVGSSTVPTFTTINQVWCKKQSLLISYLMRHFYTLEFWRLWILKILHCPSVAGSFSFTFVVSIKLSNWYLNICQLIVMFWKNAFRSHIRCESQLATPTSSFPPIWVSFCTHTESLWPKKKSRSQEQSSWWIIFHKTIKIADAWMYRSCKSPQACKVILTVPRRLTSTLVPHPLSLFRQHFCPYMTHIICGWDTYLFSHFGGL